MLQKIGALGSRLRGKKLAISLSPNWFFATKPVASVRWNFFTDDSYGNGIWQLP